MPNFIVLSNEDLYVVESAICAIMLSIKEDSEETSEGYTNLMNLYNNIVSQTRAAERQYIEENGMTVFEDMERFFATKNKDA